MSREDLRSSGMVCFTSPMNTTATAIARLFARRLGMNLLVVAGLAVVLLFGMAEGDKPSMTPAPVADAPATIMAQAGDRCWATPADHPADLAGQEPGSVVISGGEVSNPKVVHRVVEQAYFGVDHGFRIYGFCR
jgi:hypothetical protein